MILTGKRGGKRKILIEMRSKWFEQVNPKLFSCSFRKGSQIIDILRYNDVLSLPFKSSIVLSLFPPVPIVWHVIIGFQGNQEWHKFRMLLFHFINHKDPRYNGTTPTPIFRHVHRHHIKTFRYWFDKMLPSSIYKVFCMEVHIWKP